LGSRPRRPGDNPKERVSPGRYVGLVRILAHGRNPFFKTHLSVDDDGSTDLCLDGRRLTWVGPLELTGMAALAGPARVEGREVLFLEPTNSRVAEYLKTADPVGLIWGSAPSSDDARPADGTPGRPTVLLPLTRIQDADQAEVLAERITPLARPQVGAEVARALFMSLGELLDNSCSHAGSAAGVYVAAQVYAGAAGDRRGIELAVADAGIGILAHLRRNPGFGHLSSATAAIRSALKPGATGTTDRRGYGFSDMLDEVARAGPGKMVIRSGDGLARITVRGSQRKERFSAGSPAVPGTWVWVRIETS